MLTKIAKEITMTKIISQEELKSIVEKDIKENDLIDYDTGEVFDVDKAMKELQKFSSNVKISGKIVEELNPQSKYATSCIVYSESGDRFLTLEEGAKTQQQIVWETYVSDPTWWREITEVGIEEIQTIEIVNS